MSSRRYFIKNSSLLAAGAGLFTALPEESLAFVRKRISPNDKIGIGAIGINGMGWANLSTMLKSNPDTECVAICDVDNNVLDKRFAELEKNYKQKPVKYEDYRKLLADKNVDIVIIGTPDHWHCLQSVEACAAGKDVYVEKPIANSIHEIRAMVNAQQKYKRVVQVGQWQRSNGHFQSALEMLRSGKLGNIRMVKSWAYQGWMKNIPKKPDEPVPAGVNYDMWLGPARKRPFNPNRFHFNFRWFWDYAGGLMTDWGVHLVDYALLGMDARDPLTIMASGGKMAYPDDAAETPDTLATTYDFGNFILLWEHAQAINGGNYGRDHGIAYIGNNGTLVLDRGGWQIIPEGKNMEAMTVRRWDDGLANNTRNFIDVVKSRDFSKLNAPVQAGAIVATVCQMGNIAYKTGKKLKWDKNKQLFTDPEANKLITPEYHNNFKLPKI
ncbi:MAG TPA: Gfo/Idh/MocA family oxidoreductase [Chitinophagaceae bacterium]|nr:Gfo/Idh/MocA family oxidoreductase [Chitinophagaceae bacterium]